MLEFDISRYSVIWLFKPRLYLRDKMLIVVTVGSVRINDGNNYNLKAELGLVGNTK